MRLLFVAFPFSIHTARWLGQLRDTGWEIHLFSSIDNYNLHPEISGITYHVNFFDFPGEKINSNRYRSPQWSGLQLLNSPLLKKIIRKIITVSGWRKSKTEQLSELISSIKPDIIHSMETQQAGYLLAEVKKNFSGKFPRWIHSNWGIDLHFYGKLTDHKVPIWEALKSIDEFIVEGNRDAILARHFGFSGLIRTFPSVGGGFRIPDLPITPPSTRKKIIIKGTQDIFRRGLVALRSLERCADLLDDYELVLYSSTEVTRAAAELFFFNTQKKITVTPELTQHEMIQLNEEARISICVNMTDGLPNAMLEAMMMGAFPIQSNTSVADEWVVHGETGMLVPPEDPDLIEPAIRKALTDDEMVDKAALINRQKIRDELDYEKIKYQVLEMYSSSIHKA